MLKDKIFVIRNTQVMIDKDLELFGTITKVFNHALNRNIDIFPDDFRFQLTKEEKDKLVKEFHLFEKLKHSTANPKVFTEKGLYMLAKSKAATQTTLQIIETFAKIKELSENINEIMKTEDENNK